jgi:NTE family protein
MTTRTGVRPVTERPQFERLALVLQGGGALGAYQGGVYQALAEADLHPNWIGGISIGAINAAIIAGNPPKERVARLRAFWERITAPPPWIPSIGTSMLGALEFGSDFLHTLVNQTQACTTLMNGAPGFFFPRQIPPFLGSANIETNSFYDVGPLRETLEELVDFDRINARETRFAVGAVNIRAGNLEFFDNAERTLGPEHIMASGALPPGFPAVQVGGDYYWDGGLVSNTPLQWLRDSRPRQDSLVFQVDLWSARGEIPHDLVGIDLRQKDIRFSSRTRKNTDQFKQEQRLRRAAHRLLQLVSDQDLLNADSEMALLRAEADETVHNIVHLIYRAKSYEGSSKDYEFSRETMEEHWSAGYEDTARTLRHPDILKRPVTPDGVATFDLSEP